MEVMRNVEQRCIHVGHLCVSQEPLGIDRLLRPYNPMEFPLQLHSAGRPHSPMPEQPAREPKLLPPKMELGKEVKNDVVVIARVKCNLICTAGCRYTA